MRKVTEGTYPLTKSLKDRLFETLEYQYHQFRLENGELVEATLESAELLVEQLPDFQDPGGKFSYRRIWSPVADQQTLDSHVGWLATIGNETIILIRDGWHSIVIEAEPVIYLRTRKRLSKLEAAMEAAIDRWLVKHGLKPETLALHYRCSWSDVGLVRRRIEFDGYLWAVLARLPFDVAIECQGEQHSDPDHFFNGLDFQSENSRSIQERDQTKRDFCEARKVLLFEVHNEAEIAAMVGELERLLKL